MDFYFIIDLIHLVIKENEKMSENRTVCHCMNVSVADIEKAVHEAKNFSSVEQAFDKVQMSTHCSTGCGGCHDNVMDVISEVING